MRPGTHDHADVSKSRELAIVPTSPEVHARQAYHLDASNGS